MALDARAGINSARTTLKHPETQTDLLQVAKATLATVVAWLLATEVFGLQQPFLSAWAALLTVHATVYRTFWRGVQSVAATFVGIMLSFLAVELLGYGALTLGLAVLVGLLAARFRPVREEGVTIATTCLFLLTQGDGTQGDLLLHRFGDTVLGVATGLLINLIVIPPLDDRSAERHLDEVNRRLGNLLGRMADELNEPDSHEHAMAWIDETREIDDLLDHAQQTLSFTRESQAWNPRKWRSAWAGDPTSGEQLLVRLEEGVAQARAIARAVNESATPPDEWDEDFRRRWTDLLGRTGRRVADPDAEVGGLRGEVDDLTRHLSHEQLPGLLWPFYGALITGLINVIDVVDDVASMRAVREPGTDPGSEEQPEEDTRTG